MTITPRRRAAALSVVLACGVLLTAGCSSETSDTAAATSSAAAVATAAASSAATTAEDAASSGAAVASSALAAASSVAASPSGAGGNGSFTMADVAQHSTSGDCWTAIDGKVYDLTTWEDKHPGGAERIVSLCGTDGTAAFTGQHSTQEEPNETLAEYQIGVLG